MSQNRNSDKWKKLKKETEKSKLKWLNHYDGGVIKCMNESIGCIQCDDYLKFIDDSKEILYSYEGMGIGTFATHPTQSLFAISEKIPNPKIFILQYPDFNQLHEIRAKNNFLEYFCLEFVGQDILASISGLPTFELNLWRYDSMENIFSLHLPNIKPISFQFSPTYWTTFFICYEQLLHIYTIENLKRTIKKEILPPAISITGDEYEELSQCKLNDYTEESLNISESTIINLKDEEFDEFMSELKRVKRHVIKSCTWTQDNNILLGCQMNQICKVIVSTSEIFLLQPIDKDFIEKNIPIKKKSSEKHKIGLDISTDNLEGESEFRSENEDTFISDIEVLKEIFLIGSSDGFLRFITLTSDSKIKLIKIFDLTEQITCIKFFQNSSTLLIGIKNGTLIGLSTTEGSQPKELFRHDTSPILDIGSFIELPTSFVTLRESGQIEVWDSFGKIVSSLKLDYRIKVTTMSLSQISNIVAVGTTSGLIYFGNFISLKTPQWLHPRKIHYVPVVKIRFFTNSLHYIAAYKDGRVFFCSGKAKNKYEPIAYFEVSGTIVDLSLAETEKEYGICILSEEANGLQHLTFASISLDILTEKLHTLIEKRSKFSDSKIKKVICSNLELKVVSMGLTKPYSVLLMLSDNSLSLFTTEYKEEWEEKVEEEEEELYKKNTITSLDSIKAVLENIEANDRMTSIEAKLKVTRKKSSEQLENEETQEEEQDIISNPLTLKSVFEPNFLSGGKIFTSRDDNLFFTSGPFGIIKLFEISTAKVLWKEMVLSYWNKGVEHVTLCPEGQLIVFSGANGKLGCIPLIPDLNKNSITFNSIMKFKERKENFINLNKPIMRGEIIDIGNFPTMLDTYVDPTAGKTDETKNEEMISEIERAISFNQDPVFSKSKPNENSSWMQNRFYEIQQDDELIFSDIKTDLRKRIKMLRSKLLSMIEDNEKAPSLEKIPLIDFNLDEEKRQTEEREIDNEIIKMKNAREEKNLKKKSLIEIIKKECWDKMEVKGRAIKGFTIDKIVRNFPLVKRTTEELNQLEVSSSHRRIELSEIKTRLELTQSSYFYKLSKISMKSEEEQDKSEINQSPSLYYDTFHGSLGHQRGGANELFYHQMDLQTKWQKIRECIFVKDAIYKIKENFNKQFDDLLSLKFSTVDKINKRNDRIKIILEDLGKEGKPEEALITWYEKPEMLFVTNDDEIKVEKYLTPEEWKEQEEKNKIVENKGENEENWCKKGLNTMMGGVLEIKKEDELKKEIPKPTFMIEKTEDKWTEEEKKQALDYKAAIKTQKEEREKYRKSLESEYKKLSGLNTEARIEFDKKLKVLFEEKIMYDTAIYQEALKIFRLKYSMHLEDLFFLREKNLIEELENLKTIWSDSTVVTLQSKREFDAFKNICDQHIEANKNHDKNFKKEFSDIPGVIQEIVYKEYKKRPKKELYLDKDEDRDLNFWKLSNHLSELNNIKNMPEGLNSIIWSQLCNYRQEKIQMEYKLKQDAEALKELENLVFHFQQDSDQIKQKVDLLFTAISDLNEATYMFYKNSEMQLLLRQGQVEVDQPGYIKNYKECLLVHKNVIQDYNKNILIMGENKISTMVESQKFKKDIQQLEWEGNKMDMIFQDLTTKMVDINRFKVNKEVLDYLNNENYEEMKAQEIMRMEKAINHTKIFYDRQIEKMNKNFDEIKNQVTQLKSTNKKLSEKLQDLNNTILEREKIHDVVVDKSGRAQKDMMKRRRWILKRSRLSKRIIEQTKEIEELTKEVGILKERVTPSLAANKQLREMISPCKLPPLDIQK